MDVNRIVDHDEHDIARPESEHSMNDSHWILQETFRLLPHERIGHQKSSNEEEDVDC